MGGPNQTGARLTSIYSTISVQARMETSAMDPIVFKPTSEQDLALSTHKVRNSVHLLAVAFIGLRQVMKSVEEINRKGKRIRNAATNALKFLVLQIAHQIRARH